MAQSSALFFLSLNDVSVKVLIFQPFSLLFFSSSLQSVNTGCTFFLN